MLNIQNICVAYAQPAKAVLHDIHFSLKLGEIGCLLGESGSGKSTLLRAIAGFEPIARGSIFLGNTCLSTSAMVVPPEKRQVGLMFQDYGLFPHLRVFENIAFGLTHWEKSAKEARLQYLLEMVELGTLAHRYPHELSGGQQQRVALARALAPRPQLLLLDEPFSNLDHSLRESLSNKVRAILKKEQTTALMVTHHQTEAFVMADQVGVLMSGRLQQWSTPYQLYHAPINRDIAVFVGAGHFIRATPIDEHRVVTALGTFQLSACPTHRANENGWEVLIRPDDVAHDDNSPHTAVVLDKTFRGADFLYTLALPNGEKICSLVPSHHNHAIGEAIGIRATMDHVNVF